MSAEKVKVKLPDGQEADAVPVEVTGRHEPITTYTLADGFKVNVQIVLTKMFRIEGAKDELGNPVYIVQSKNVASTERV